MCFHFFFEPVQIKILAYTDSDLFYTELYVDLFGLSYQMFKGVTEVNCLSAGRRKKAYFLQMVEKLGVV